MWNFPKSNCPLPKSNCPPVCVYIKEQKGTTKEDFLNSGSYRIREQAMARSQEGHEETGTNWQTQLSKFVSPEYLDPVWPDLLISQANLKFKIVYEDANSLPFAKLKISKVHIAFIHTSSTWFKPMQYIIVLASKLIGSQAQ
jgi:hypothetical protein